MYSNLIENCKNLFQHTEIFENLCLSPSSNDSQQLFLGHTVENRHITITTSDYPDFTTDLRYLSSRNDRKASEQCPLSNFARNCLSFLQKRAIKTLAWHRGAPAHADSKISASVFLLSRPGRVIVWPPLLLCNLHFQWAAGFESSQKVADDCRVLKGSVEE